MSGDQTAERATVGEDLKWVKGVLDRGLTGESGLTDYDERFLLDLDKRLARFGAQTFLSPKQRDWLVKIDAKLKEAERLEEYGGSRATDELDWL